MFPDLELEKDMMDEPDKLQVLAKGEELRKQIIEAAEEMFAVMTQYYK